MNASKMNQSFSIDGKQLIVPSHDCRPENIKYKIRDTTYDASILSTGLRTTQKSLAHLKEKYLDSLLKRRQNLYFEIEKNFKNRF